jgi:hypothetical protein
MPEHLRRRLEQVFGDVLPETTSDDRDDEEPPVADVDEHLLAERPPHHDQER